jgi:hypothetical protein
MYRFLVETKNKVSHINDYIIYEMQKSKEDIELFKLGKKEAIKEVFLHMRMEIQDYFYDTVIGIVSNNNNEVENMMYELKFIEQYEIMTNNNPKLKFKCKESE